MNKMQEIRTSKGMSRSKLAKIVNVPETRIIWYDREYDRLSRATFETMLRIANALEVKPSELVEGDELREILIKNGM